MVKFRLQELEINNFKSFGERAFLVFPSNLNVVLGPNGSGKSNVVDAIRWVLGDQSFRMLRISEPEDLLYMGDRSGANLAWVRIAFESEAGSFEIQRKLYRSGEQEYRLNGQPARLKDIQRFLAEHQLGTRGFTVVNQGSSDLFIKATPEERYLMLSEILGIRALELKRLETKKNLETIRERLKLAKLKLRTLEPQADIFIREREKRERRLQLTAKQTEVVAAIQSVQKFVLERRLMELTIELEQVGVARVEAERQVEASTSSVEEAGASEQLTELRQRERSLWAEKSALLEQRQIVRSGQSLIGTIRAGLQKLLTLKDIDRVHQLVVDLLAQLQGGGKGVTEAEPAATGVAALPAELIAEDTSRTERERIEHELKEVTAAIAVEEERERATRAQVHETLAALRELQRQALELTHRETTLKREREAAETQLHELTKIEARSGTEAELANLVREQETIQAELARIGEIYEEVIQKGEKILEHLELLRREVTDLEDSVTKVETLLHEYESEIHRTFHDGVRKINQALIEYVHTLYGGEAKLTIRDERQVHIAISHPQKKIRVLEALSGGEKAMFAIALIFALIRISEPPFLVLDEIDSSLDENNAQKFGRFLSELSQRTQFVIVSHNRATIEAGEILFGVSIQKGSSKIFSLKLKEALEKIEA